jgi:hypothetical protein
LLKTRFGEFSDWQAQAVSPDLARPCWIRRPVDSVKGDVVAANERRATLGLVAQLVGP